MHIGRASRLVWKTRFLSFLPFGMRTKWAQKKSDSRHSNFYNLLITHKREISFQTTISKAIAPAQMDFHPSPVTETLQSNSSDYSE